MRRSGVRFAVALALAACAAGTASAADVQFDPSIELGGQYSDNYTLERAANLINEVSGAFLDASFLVRAESPRSAWRFEPRIRKTYFPDDSELESTDYFGVLSGEMRNERSTLGMLAELYDQNVVTSQLPGANFDNPNLGDSGSTDSGRLVSGDNRQKLVQLRPFADFELSERTTLRVEALWLDVSFDREVTDFAVSYQSKGAGLRLSRRFTQASSFGLLVDYNKFEPDVGNNDSDLYTAQLQWDYQVGERVSAYARAGGKRSKFNIAGATPLAARSVTETTPLFAAGARWNFQRSDLFLDLQRQVDANSSGFVVQREDVRLQYNHRFTQRLRGYLALYGIRDRTVTDVTRYAPRRYVDGAAGMEWRFKQSWSLLGEAGWSNQKFDGDPGAADRKSVQLSVAYRPLRRD